MKRNGWAICVLIALFGCSGTTRRDKDDVSLFSDGSPGITGGASGFGGRGGSAGLIGQDASADARDASTGGIAGAGAVGGAGGSGGTGDATLFQPTCFDAPPLECGVLSQWPAQGAKDRSGRWTLVRALPLEGSDGFAALVTDGDPSTGDYHLTLIQPDNGCFSLKLSSPFSPDLGLRGIYRAIFRGGTFAILAQCLGRFYCGRTLFVNEAAWPDPAGTPKQGLLDIAVAADGKVLAVSSEAVESDGAATDVLVEQWVSSQGQVLAEHKQPMPGHIVKVAVLENDTIAIAVQPEGAPDYVLLQSKDFETLARFEPGGSQRIQTLAAQGSVLGVAGVLSPSVNPSGLWLGQVDGQTGAAIWIQPRADLSSDTMGLSVNTLGIEFDAQGGLNALVWRYNGSYVLLGSSHDRQATPSPVLDTGAPSTFGRMINAAVRTQRNGSLLWAGELWGRYCAR